MTNLLLWAGWISIFCLGLAVVWSILVPKCRLWPSGNITAIKVLYIWGPTILYALSIFVLALGDWNHFGWAGSLRWGLGLPLLVIGHIIVYGGVFKIGYKATSGAATGLKINGIYAYSRNPQYTADIIILLGIIVFSASLVVLPLALAGIFVLILAPFSEEPWLREVYGKPYTDYCKRVRRFL